MEKQERLESMSADGSLSLFKQEDGDIVIQVKSTTNSFGNRRINGPVIASVEFCTPISGGGGSKRTWRALVDLMEAMRLDNEDASQNSRNPAH